MKLGENIYRLRTLKGLSQDALAEMLDVSRQSVSKWETGASVPELDKLIRLSEIFGITLDELVRGAEAGAETPGEANAEADAAAGAQPRQERPQVEYVVVRERSGRRTAGIILLCMGFLVLLLLAVLGGAGTGLALALPFVLCGVICLTVRRHTGLWCAWVVYILAELYMRYATGIMWNWVFSAILRANAELSIHLIVSAGLFACRAALIIATAWCLRRRHIDLRTRWLPTLITALVILAARIAVPRVVNGLLFEYLYGYNSIPVFPRELILTLIQWLGTALETALLVIAARCVRWNKAQI